MSIPSLAGSGLGLPQPVRSRSQLVTNRFLIALSQVFGWEAFTSRDVSKRFGLDFLNTAKRLSRMAHAPYYLLSVRKVPRPYGGYENSYTISTKGWRKVSYLQGRPVHAQKPVAGNSLDEVEAAHYLAKGEGKEYDLPGHLLFKLVAPMFPPVYPRLDEEGLLLLHSELAAIPFEASLMDCPRDDALKTVGRAFCLQSRGLIPQNINVLMFVLNAYERGSSSSTILLSLVIRGGLKLRDELAMSEIFSRMKSILAAKHPTSPTPHTHCENCHRYENLLEIWKLYTNYLEGKISSLRNELEDAHQDNLHLHNRISELKNHIAMTSRCLGLVTDGLDKIKDPPITLLPVKVYINTALAGIVLMNCLVS